ncbi:hypothetical protein NDU88_005487 [Pleurodeles waltl]|uniref:Uncharacterized protein n=1 Tax=Pleurodeles waltl TaxID=8319 RepID=A0AAV7RJ87_PLEWA|nr:hypothetical protein NDU88_005487 [Pleurodeles waltl]
MNPAIYWIRNGHPKDYSGGLLAQETQFSQKRNGIAAGNLLHPHAGTMAFSERRGTEEVNLVMTKVRQLDRRQKNQQVMDSECGAGPGSGREAQCDRAVKDMEAGSEVMLLRQDLKNVAERMTGTEEPLGNAVLELKTMVTQLRQTSVGLVIRPEDAEEPNLHFV